MPFKNYEMELMVESLTKHLDRRDVVGYAVAKNINILREAAREYLELKDALIRAYGEQVIDENGVPTPKYRLEIGSEGHSRYMEEIQTFANAEGDPDLYKVRPEDVIGKLSGQEILELHWMIEE